MRTDRRPEELDRLFRLYRDTGKRSVRNELVEAHRHLAEFYAKRYVRRGVTFDDLQQVAFLALLHAVERFDPDYGVAFGTFAGRTIDGELKRYFRDRCWSIRPPRRTQELHLEVRQSQADLTQALGRSPTVPELARALAVGEDDVVQALEAGVAYQTASLDQSPGDENDDTSTLERYLGTGERGYSMVDHRLVLREVIAELPERDRQVIRMRFFENMTQPQIAEVLGVSQSYLSRILRRALLRMRQHLAGDGSLDDTELLDEAVHRPAVGSERR